LPARLQAQQAKHLLLLRQVQLPHLWEKSTAWDLEHGLGAQAPWRVQRVLAAPGLLLLLLEANQPLPEWSVTRPLEAY